MRRLVGLVTLVLVIHGMVGLWVLRSARLGAAPPDATTVTQVELRPREAPDRSTAPSAAPRAASTRSMEGAALERDARAAQKPSPADAVQPTQPSTESSTEGSTYPRGPGSQAATEAASAALSSTSTDPARSGSASTDPASTDPASTDPASTDPASTDPASTDPASSPADSDPAAAPGAEPNPARASPAPDARERIWPELTAGRSTRRLRVYFGDYTAAQPVARLQLEVEVTPPHFRLRSVGEAEGLIALFYSGTLTQESRGQLGVQGLLPQEYVETRGSRRQRAVRFDQTAGQLLPADAPAVALPQGTQDRLSVLYQLGLMARAHPERFVAGAVIELPVAGLREVRRERFEVVGDELLIVQDRPLRTLHLKRPLIQAGRDPSVQVWLGYDAGLQPVRIRLEDAKGQVLDQVIDEP